MSRRQPQRRLRQLAPKLAPAGALAATALLVFAVQLARGRSEATAPPAAGERSSLVAMARLEPSSHVVRLAAAIDDVVAEVRVAEGQAVEEGDVLLVQGGHALRQAELEAARLRLERVELKPFEVEAQRARLRAIEAELAHAQQEVEEQQGLSAKGYMTGKEFRDARLRARQAAESRSEARAILSQLEQGLELERREAANEVEQAEVRLEQTLVRAPFSGTVLKLPVRPGERSGTRPLLEMGRTDPMYAMAEVHANDIRLVEPGQKARFSSPALPREIDGVVEDVGVIVHNNGVYGEDPSAPRGVRVFQVRVRLADSELASRFTNLEGQVRILLGGPSDS